jgi:hypothetical protein
LETSVDVDFDEIRERVTGHRFWPSYLEHTLEPLSPIGIHLAIFSEPFLTHILEGRKTIESRFSRSRCAPFGGVVEGDVILVKQVAGPICGLSLVRQVWFFDLAYEPLEKIKTRYAAGICADEDFWELRRDTSYATLIQLEETVPIEPVWCDKRDRRGWVSLRSRQMALAF